MRVRRERAGSAEAYQGAHVVLLGLSLLELVSSAQWMEMWARAHVFVLPSGYLGAT